MSEAYDVEHIDGLIDAFAAELRERAASLVAGGTADGLRLGTATAFLFRGVELLDAAKASQDPPLRPAAELLMRSAIEVALRGRYLLVGGDRDDEFARLLGDYLDRGEKLAKTIGTTFGGVAPWVLQVVQPSTKPPRDLASIAKALDKLSGREATSRWSAEYLYEWLYRWLSNSAEHAGIAAVGRFVESHDAINPTPEPLSTARWHIVIAGQLGELAREVYTAHGVSTDPLDEIGVHLPPP
jgi:hypothetical protein